MRRLIAREQISGRAPSGFALEINVSQRLTVVVADDEAASVVLFDIPGRREAAIGHCRVPIGNKVGTLPCPGFTLSNVEAVHDGAG
jgi:hypothetical protein